MNEYLTRKFVHLLIFILVYLYIYFEWALLQETLRCCNNKLLCRGSLLQWYSVSGHKPWQRPYCAVAAKKYRTAVGLCRNNCAVHRTCRCIQYEQKEQYDSYSLEKMGADNAGFSLFSCLSGYINLFFLSNKFNLNPETKFLNIFEAKRLHYIQITRCLLLRFLAKNLLTFFKLFYYNNKTNTILLYSW